MHIVIAGAGGMGFHLAQLLSSEKQDIVLIDIDKEVLDLAQLRLDVTTVKGDSSSLAILNEAEVSKAKLFIAVTTSEKNNLITSILAKKLGAKQTIARVANNEYMLEDQRSNFAELGVDHIISPIKLGAQEIERLIVHSEVTDHFEFEDGKFILSGIRLDEESRFVNRTVSEVDAVDAHVPFKPIAILRDSRTIIPDKDTILRKNDHIYFLTEKDAVSILMAFLDKKLVKVKNIMILGGTELALHTALLLEKKYQVKIIEPDKERGKHLIEHLDHTLVVEGDPNNIVLLRDEGLENVDAFIALTPNSETNIITSLMAEQSGVFKTIAEVENIDYTHISQHIGVDTLINTKLIAANNIFRFVRKGKIEAITSPHGVEAEIIEFVVHKNNQLTKKPICNLHFPDQCVIGGIIRGEQSLIPTPDFQLQVDDCVIVFVMPESIDKVVRLFQ